MADDDPRFAPFVERLVPDPAAPPRTTLVAGFLGRSSVEGHTRVYLTPDLASWFDVPDDALLHAEPRADGSGLGGHHVWLDASAAQAATNEALGAWDPPPTRNWEACQTMMAPCSAPTSKPCATSEGCPPPTMGGCWTQRFCPPATSDPHACHTKQPPACTPPAPTRWWEHCQTEAPPCPRPTFNWVLCRTKWWPACP